MSDIRSTSVRRAGDLPGGGYLIGPGLAGAIKTLISQNESAVNSKPIRVTPVLLEDDAPRRGGKTFRICTFTGAWSTGSFKTVTFKYSTTTPNTASAINLFFSLPDDGTKDCAIAKDGTAWHLIQWQWVVSQCSTATSS